MGGGRGFAGRGYYGRGFYGYGRGFYGYGPGVYFGLGWPYYYPYAYGYPGYSSCGYYDAYGNWVAGPCSTPPYYYGY